MAGANLKRLERRLTKALLDNKMLRARFEFPISAMRVEDREALMKVGGLFTRFLLARGFTGGQLNPTALDEELGTAQFVGRSDQVYGNWPSAVSVARSGYEGGLQDVFTRMAKAWDQELKSNWVSYIFAKEVDDTNGQQVASIARQLQSGALKGVSLGVIMMDWKKLVLLRVQEKLKLTMQLGGTVDDEEDN